MCETLAPEMKKKIVERRRIWWQKKKMCREIHSLAQIINPTCCHKICQARLDLNYSRLMY